MQPDSSDLVATVNLVPQKSITFLNNSYQTQFFKKNILRSIHMYKKKAPNTLIFYDSEKSQFSSVKLNSELKFLQLAHGYNEAKCPGKFIH